MNRLKQLLPNRFRTDEFADREIRTHEFLGDLALSGCGVVLSAAAFGLDAFQGNPAFVLIGIVAAIVAVLSALGLDGQ
jgi:hypothetical protein